MSHTANRSSFSPPPRPPDSTPSDYTVDTNSTAVNTPTSAPTPSSPVHHRTVYRRLASLPELNDQDTAYHGPEESPRHTRNNSEQGLGIKVLRSLPSALAIGQNSPDTPGSSKPLLSPTLNQQRREYQLQDDQIREGNENWHDYAPGTEPYQPFVAGSETENLRKQATVRSFEPPGKCLLPLPLLSRTAPRAISELEARPYKR